MESQFNETSIKFFNNSLSSTLSKVKDALSNLKNKLIQKLLEEINKIINEKINANYSKYIDFLLENFKKISVFMDKPPEILIISNSKDFEYFNKNINELKKLFKNNIVLQISENVLVGGFQCVHPTINLSYDFTFKTLLNRNFSIIEMELSKMFSKFDPEIQKIQLEYEKFIQNQKSNLREIIQENGEE